MCIKNLRNIIFVRRWHYRAWCMPCSLHSTFHNLFLSLNICGIYPITHVKVGGIQFTKSCSMNYCWNSCPGWYICLILVHAPSSTIIVTDFTRINFTNCTFRGCQIIALCWWQQSVLTSPAPSSASAVMVIWQGTTCKTSTCIPSRVLDTNKLFLALDCSWQNLGLPKHKDGQQFYISRLRGCGVWLWN